MKTLSFVFDDNVLNYQTYGSGKNIFLAFHGYAQNHEVFRNFASTLGEDYKIFSFDLFMHGQSNWRNKKNKLSKEYWKIIISEFLLENNINVFSLLGFSMGGKFVLAILESFPDKIQKVILIAPDGVNTNFWFSIATLPGWTGKLFKSVVINPLNFQLITKVFRKLKIVDKGLVRFAEGQLKTREQRLRVYFSWIIFSDFKFNLKEIAGIINKNKIDLTIFVGKYDKVITEKNMKILIQLLKNPKLIVLETGHTFLIESVSKWITNNKLLFNIDI